MIPVAPPSLGFVFMVLVLLGTTLLWLVWTLSLLFQPPQQKLPTKWHKLLYAATISIALWTLYQLLDFKWQMDAYKVQMQAQFAPSLQTPTRLAGINMPAQTQLRLALAYRPESFQKARFPTPVNIAGIPAVEVERTITILSHGQYPNSDFRAESMRITGSGVTLQEGWRCDASHAVEFDLNPNEDIAAFKHCTLAADNAAANIQLPKGTEVWRTEGNVYTDGFVDKDRWSLHTPADQVVEIAGLPLQSPFIRLTEERKLHEVSRAILAHTARIAEQSYPAGTQLHFNARAERAERPEQWTTTTP